VKRVAAEIAATEPRIDVLINNAGALFSSREEAHRHEISRTMTGAPARGLLVACVLGAAVDLESAVAVGRL